MGICQNFPVSLLVLAIGCNLAQETPDKYPTIYYVTKGSHWQSQGTGPLRYPALAPPISDPAWPDSHEAGQAAAGAPYNPNDANGGLAGHQMRKKVRDFQILKNKAHFSFSTPECAGLNYYNNSHGDWSWCSEDQDYPKEAIEAALVFHNHYVFTMHKDVNLLEASKAEETLLKGSCQHPLGGATQSLCPSDFQIIYPKRALGPDGRWHIILNGVDIKTPGGETFQLNQSAGVERCKAIAQKCPLVPEGYNSRCVQKSNFQRFIAFDPFEYYLPFRVVTARLPTSCDCHTGSFSEPVSPPCSYGPTT